MAASCPYLSLCQHTLKCRRAISREGVVYIPCTCYYSCEAKAASIDDNLLVLRAQFLVQLPPMRYEEAAEFARGHENVSKRAPRTPQSESAINVEDEAGRADNNTEKAP